MRTVIIHGQSHKGSTYRVARMIADRLEGEKSEFFLPRDFKDHCIGCTLCFIKSEELCPHRACLKPIVEAIDSADVVILASPVYVFHVTGAMKSFLDHLGYRWMPHRPEGAMFGKQGVCVATAAGAGIRSTLKDMEDSLFFWGTGKIYKYGVAVETSSWDKVSQKKKDSIEAATAGIAEAIAGNHGKITPSLKTRALFNVMRQYQKKGLNPVDSDYWKEKGWLENTRPWK